MCCQSLSVQRRQQPTKQQVGYQEAKYKQLASTHALIPVAIETAGTWNHLHVHVSVELNAGARPRNVSRH